MQVLRDNKESLMAVLEAFVYDPLINWRLMQTDVEARRTEGSKFSRRNSGWLSNLFLTDSEADRERSAVLAKVAAYPQAPARKLKADESHIFNGMFS